MLRGLGHGHGLCFFASHPDGGPSLSLSATALFNRVSSVVVVCVQCCVHLSRLLVCLVPWQ